MSSATHPFAVVRLLCVFGLALCAEAPALGAPPPADQAEAVGALCERLLGDRASDFAFEVLTTEGDGGAFEISAEGGRATIRGSDGVAMAAGLNWYLNHHCHFQTSLYGVQLDLPERLPDVSPAVRRTSPHRWRYFLNYCAFGYSLAWWDWAEWERLIDWMALHGVNMPLAVTGQEAVWQAVGKRIGLTDDEMRAFLAGPPYLPFGWMGCLDGWGGPLPQAWIDSHAELGRRILERERSLGMTPVLQGFTGHVPRAVERIHPDAAPHSVRWVDWETTLLDPTSPAFGEIARVYLEEQRRLFGTDHLYAADTFIEMNPPSGDPAYLARLAKAIYDGMAASDPDAVWVLQGWIFVNNARFWTLERGKAFLDAVPDDRLVLLDLYCEKAPAWTRTRSFHGKPWIWCVIQSFGRQVRLEGNPERINHDLFDAMASPERGRLSGVGMVNEGIDYNPVVFDLLFETAWRENPVDLDDWVREYAHHRYGADLPEARIAWRALFRSAYQGNEHSTSNVARRPSLDPIGGAAYDVDETARAWRELLACSNRLRDVDTYRFDVVNVGRQALVNLAPRLHAEAARAFRAGDEGALLTAARRYESLLRDIDRLLSTRKEFLLGRDLENAKRWATAPDERALLEWNARNVITLWGGGRNLNDYACKEWGGLVGGLHVGRWRILVEHMRRALRENRAFDAAACETAIWEFERDWTHGSEAHPSSPRGDSVRVALELLETYGDLSPCDAPSLTTGKPARCSRALAAYPPEYANDGVTWDRSRHWATDVADGSEAWWQVDLEAPTEVSRIVVVGYYGDERSYGFTVEISLDGETWTMVGDLRDNSEPSTAAGCTVRFEPTTCRFIRVNQTSNSANTGRHLVEVMAYAE